MDSQASKVPGTILSERKVTRPTDHIPKVVVENERLRLKPRIGLWTAVAFVVGAIIGSGIFISPRGALANSGSVGLSLVVWAVCGIISMLLGFVYAELGVIFPKSGGDYAIIKEGIGDVPAFLIAWTQCLVTQAGSRTVVALVFADYVCVPFFGGCPVPNNIRKSIAAGKLLMIAITNAISVRLVASIQGFFSSTKVIALVVITIGGIFYMSEGRLENFSNSFEGSSTDITNIALACYSCMWAYAGFSNLNEITEEIINPKKNIPLAIVISLTLVTGIYITTNVSYFVLLSKSDFLSVPAVAYAWGERALGSAAIIIPICVMLSVYGAANGGFFTDVRTRFAAARSGHLPEVLSFLHHETRIPLASLVLNTTISLTLLIPGDISQLINLVSFVGFLQQGLTVASLLRFRYQRRHLPMKKGEFRMPIIVPVFALLICSLMFVAPFINDPKVEFFYGLGFILSGFIVYIPFVYLERKTPGFDKVTSFAQLMLQICPTVLDADLQMDKQ